MLEKRLSNVADLIGRHFDQVLSDFPPGPLTQAMSYAVAGGKRLRGFLVLESAALHGISTEQAIWAATGIEAMHAYSLVHDDLPAMDNDDLRRGRPTVHIQWDEATAILVGDALQSLAFELVTHPDSAPDTTTRLALSVTLAQAVGARGMVLGQAMDIAAETSDNPLSLHDITELQYGKTGALFEWSAMAGPRMTGQDTGPLETYARALGLAFQIQDDIIDVTGDAVTAGKAVGKDGDAGKATFVSLMGLDGARTRACDLIEEAIEAISCYGDGGDCLRDLARFVISRDN